MFWYRFLSQALAEALKVDTTVKNIHLSWNRIGNEGAVAWLHLVALEKKNDIAWIRLILVYGICLSLQVADCTPSFCHLGVLLPSHVRDSWKILPNCWTTCPMPLMSYKSQTSIVRIVPIGSMQYIYIFTYIYYKDQPNVGKYTIHGSHWVHHDSIFTTPFWNHQLPNTRLLLPCRCNSMTSSSRSCWLSMLRHGPEGGQRMANHFKPENLQRHVQHQTFEAKRSRVEVNVNESLTCLDGCRWSSSWSVISIFEWDIRMWFDLNWSKSQLTSVVSFRNLHHLHSSSSSCTKALQLSCANDVFWWRSSTTVALMTCTSVLMWRCLGCISPTYPRPMPF